MLKGQLQDWKDWLRTYSRSLSLQRTSLMMMTVQLGCPLVVVVVKEVVVFGTDQLVGHTSARPSGHVVVCDAFREAYCTFLWR